MIISDVRPPYTIFLLSPANLGGERARLVFRPEASFTLARQLRTPEGAPLGDVFSFVSGLYFRGKATYARAFGQPPPELAGGLVISPAEGLRFLNEPVTLQRLLGWAEIPIDATEKRFTAPLIRHATALERAYGSTTRFVLLGSVASDKYVVPLTRVFGDHLLFPAEFVGRGDMSRGAMLLRAARAGRELEYIPVEGARRHGPRAVRLTAASPLRPVGSGLEMVILVGLPGAGKTTFVRRHLATTHLHVSGDREGGGRQPWPQQARAIEDALHARRPVVVDNTNVTVAERARLIAVARRHQARVVGYFFHCEMSDCLARNDARAGKARVPRAGLFAIAKRLIHPQTQEGFDSLYTVRPSAGGEFEVLERTEAPVPTAGIEQES